MSRIIYLRSPYFIKAPAPVGKTLSSAQLDLYIWKGDLTDAPTTPTRSLEKSTEDSGNNYVTFEISEICRDFLEVNFNGVERDSEPIYINYELTHTYSDATTDIYSNIVFGLDGYKDFGEGLQVSENLFNQPSSETVIDEDDNITISIKDDTSGSDDREYKTGADITITATYTPSNATLQWFKGTDEIDGETNSTYTITNAQLSDEDTYFCRAYLNEDLSNEEYVDSNDIQYTLKDCPTIYFNPDAQGSSYLSAGGKSGTTISIDVVYNTSCYNEIVTTDVTMSKGDSSPFTVTSVTTADVGDDKKTTVLLTTKGKNIGSSSAKQDRVIIKYFDKSKSYSTPKNINVQQLSATAAITSISWVGLPESDSIGGDYKFIVAGEVGATYELLVIPKYYDRDNDGKITDEPDYEWISESNLDSLTGTIEEDGDTEHTITVPSNDTAYQRIFNIVARNTEDSSNAVVLSDFTQDNVLDFANLQLTDITFTDDTKEDMTFKYYSNTNVEVRITKGADGFRLISPEISDPGPPKVIFEEESETSVLYRGASALAGSDLTVRCLSNEGKQRDGEISIFFENSSIVQDTLTLTQPGPDDYCIWQSFLSGPGNRTSLDALNIGATASAAGAFGYFIEINSSVPWTVTVPDGIALKKSITDPVGFGTDVSGLAGEWSFHLITDGDNASVETREFSLVLTSDDDDFTSTNTLVVTQAGSAQLDDDAPVFDSIKLHDATRETVLGDWTLGDDTGGFTAVYGKSILEGYGLQALASDTNSGDIEYQWYVVFSFFPDNPSKIAGQTGNTFYFTPSSAGTLTYRCLVTNTTTGLSRWSDDAVITVNANDAAGVVDWIQSDDIVEDQYGNKNIEVPWTGGTYEIEVANIAADKTWTWQVTDFTTDLVVENDVNGMPEESPSGTGLGPQTTSITFGNNYVSQKFVNLGFYGGPEANPNVIVKFTQAFQPANIPSGGGSNTPPLSNSGSSNAAPEQNNEPNVVEGPSSEVLSDLEKLLNDLEQGALGGGIPPSAVTETVSDIPPVNEVTNAEPGVVADPNIGDVLSDLESLQELLDNIPPPNNNDDETDNGSNEEETDGPVTTTPAVGGGGGNPKPKPEAPPETPNKGWGGTELL